MQTQINCIAAIHLVGVASLCGAQLLTLAKLLEFDAKLCEVRRLS